MAPSVNMDPVVWNQSTTTLNGSLAVKTNEISVMQGRGSPTLPVTLVPDPLSTTPSSPRSMAPSPLAVTWKSRVLLTVSPNTSSLTSGRKTRLLSAKRRESPCEGEVQSDRWKRIFCFCRCYCCLRTHLLPFGFFTDVQMFTVVTTTSRRSNSHDAAMLLC